MTARVRVLFLADAGPAVGGGHVMRCLTLAGALARAGGVCAFVTTPAVDAVLEPFAGPAIGRLPAEPGEDGALAAIRLAKAWGADAMVLDHYGLGGEAHEAAIGLGGLPRPALVVMDDLKRPHVCELVIDSNPGRTAEDYPGPPALTGPAFALVRPAFAALRAQALARRASGGGVERVLVSLGLTDVGGVTERVVRALAPSLGDRRIDVVMGGAAPSLAALRRLAGEDARLSLHVDTQAMAELTARADLAVGAGGSSVWERCCLGLPALTVVLAENQRGAADALAAAGATVVVDAAAADFDARLVERCRALLDDEGLRRRMSAASAALCDGLGAERAAAQVLDLVLDRRRTQVR